MLDATMHGGEWPSLIARRLRRGAGRLDSFEGRLRLACPLIAEGGFFRQTALNDGRQTGRYPGGQRWWRLMKNGGADLEGGPSLKRRLTRRRLIKHHSKGPQVAAVVPRLAAQHFRRHVGQCPTGRDGGFQRLH